MYDVIVVGAGAAGLAAARVLIEANRSVLILEARDRIGGRMFSTQAPGVPIAIELGAEFIHGRPPEIQWPNVRRMRGTRWYVDAGGGPRTQEPDDGVQDLLESLDKYKGPDISFADYLRQHATHFPEDTRMWAKEYVEGFNAADAERIGVCSLIKEDRAAERDDGEKLFCLNDGYTSFAHSLLPEGAELRLNNPVEEIRWQPGIVEAAGQRAKAMIITIPLGVLQTGRIRFAPELPQKIETANRIAFGPVVRITFHFRDRFWEAAVRDLCMLHTSDIDFPTWWSAKPDNSAILTAWAAGPRAERLRHNSRDQNIDLALKSIGRLLAVESKQHVIAAYTHDWQADPYSLGAYSYIPAGATSAPALLAKSVEDTLYFAGEATETSGRSATVHGAIATGHRAATQILKG